jgi:hypothetical protein
MSEPGTTPKGTVSKPSFNPKAAAFNPEAAAFSPVATPSGDQSGEHFKVKHTPVGLLVTPGLLRGEDPAGEFFQHYG